ncbi:MAG: lysophospholipid acyltransferase family protein [Rhodospirillales bacterium]
MIAVRSFLFAVGALIWTGGLSILYLPLLVAPRHAIQRAARFWIRGLMWWLAVTCGLRYRIEGGHHLPSGPVVVAAKHQSAWDTLIFHLVLPDPVFVLKRELFRVPFLGWYLRKAGCVGVDRSAGYRALKEMVPAAERALAAGSQIVLFPEGTRTAPGRSRRYQPGIAVLDADCGAAVVPAALNSGVFWARRSFRKSPGVITLEFLPPMPKGLERRAFLAALAERIETAAERLRRRAIADGAVDNVSAGSLQSRE